MQMGRDEVRRSLQNSVDVILFSFYPHRHLAPTVTNILQRGNPCCMRLKSPRARLTWIRGEKGEGDDETGDKELWGEVRVCRGTMG